MHKLAITKRSFKHHLWLVTLIISFLFALWLKEPVSARLLSQGAIAETRSATNPVLIAQIALPESIQSSINQGLVDYNNGQLASAIAHWETAISRTKVQPNAQLTTAYLLSNIATSQQQLGQQQLAQQTIAQAIDLVKDWPDKSLAYWEISARVLNTKGQTQWQQGQIQSAFNTWQQAEQHYRQSNANSANSEQLNHQDGLILTQVNQALALQELGLNARAVKKLNQLKPQIETLSTNAQLTATTEFGRALRQVGELSAAQSILLESLSTTPASSLDSSAKNNQLKLQLELANTDRALSHRATAIGDRAMALTQAEQALSNYNSVAQNSTNPQIQTQAQLNQLSYLIETGRLEEGASLAREIRINTEAPNQISLEAAISYAHSLSCLQSPTYCIKQEWQSLQADYQPTAQRSAKIVTLLQKAIAKAQTLQNPVLESYAVGELGHLYELTNQNAEALGLTERAIALLEGKQHPETAYLWEWQLGRLYERNGNQQQAIVAYQQAIASLANVRQNLIAIDAQAQFSFLDNVEPVYRELAALLLTQSSMPTQESLRLAVQTIDALQLTELENFLGCNLSALVNITETSTDPNALEIHPIILPNSLAIITEVAGEPLQLQTVEVSQFKLNETLATLRADLTLPGKTPQVLASATQLYDWLIAPIAPVIEGNEQIETLVFVPDGLLRNIPIGVLYDGEEYLIEKGYALAIAPQLNLFAPAKNSQPLRILTGGVNLAQTIRGQEFSPIEFLDAELAQIPEQFTVAPPLLNESFTQNNLEQQLSTERYTAIHWKTHGVFSSIPTETFLVAYRDGITANELSTLVRSASERQTEPLELVVLSACETALGDRRAVLGLAGIAVRAGSRSTLSTLWRADDGANTRLMNDFYQGLQTGLSKAQALQNAQQALLAEGGYPAPYYWAPYVIVGNWL